MHLLKCYFITEVVIKMLIMYLYTSHIKETVHWTCHPFSLVSLLHNSQWTTRQQQQLCQFVHIKLHWLTDGEKEHSHQYAMEWVARMKTKTVITFGKLKACALCMVGDRTFTVNLCHNHMINEGSKVPEDIGREPKSPRCSDKEINTMLPITV